MGRGGKAAHGSLQAQTMQGVTVTTVPCGRLHGNLEYGGAYDPATRSLVLCTANGVYRLDMTGNVVGAGAGAGPGEAGAPEPVLVAGSDVDVEGDGEVASGEEVGDATDEGEEEEEREEESEGGESEETGSEDDDDDDDDDVEDGEGQASFSFITGVALDGKGCAWVLDRTPSYLVYVASERRVLRVDLGSGGGGGGGAAGAGGAGAVTCVVGDEQVAALKDCQHPVILRNGFLAMVSTCDCTVLLLDLKLTPPSHGPGGSNCDSHTLGSDLGALLARQPDGSADVEVEVGGQVFAAHRIVLAARSPYFRQRLDPGAGFADAEGARLSLPDADPGVFAAVLRYMYTDSAGAVPPELLQPVGELADRLLLPGLCAHVGQQLLGTVCPRSVVDLLLWSEQRRGSFGALLGGLKDWFLGHHAQGEGGWVLGKEDVLRLMREGPEELAMELLYNERPDVRGYKRKRGE